MQQKAVQTKKRIEFLDKILSAMESHELFCDLVSRERDTESQIQKALFLRLQKKLPWIIQSIFGYNEKKANKIVDTQFAWEQKKKISVKNFPFFATNHRPDAQLVVDNLRIGIEIKKGDNGLAIRSGIGQSVVYSTQFDFVLYFFVDISKGFDIKSSTSALKEAELIKMLWDSFNIRFRVV